MIQSTIVGGYLLSKRKHIEPATEVILKNQAVMNQLRIKNDEITDTLNRKLKANITTYGCQMNEHDSEKLHAMLNNMGYEIVDTRNNVDLVIFNTCCVRENAELRVYGNLGKLKADKLKNPDMVIAVCGCMMQQPHVVEEIKKKYSHVDLVFGTHNLHNFPSLLHDAYDQSNVLVEVWDHEGEVIEGLESKRKFGLKAFVDVMYGCNNFCTYCIVPYTRGRERSREVESVLTEVKELVSKGVKEVTLLGQNVNSYGKTLEEDIDFSDLIRMVNDIEGIERIRFMTSHPKDISDRLIDAIVECEHVCEHVHLPVQAGSDSLLKRMNRKYDREHYLNIVEKIKSRIPGVSLSTDMIVGFPGETDEEFLDTMDLIKQVEYDAAFTFIYSKRTGTPAAEMDNHIDDKLKHERFNIMLAEINKIIREKNDSFKDTVVEVLVEAVSSKDDTVVTGRTRGNRPVNFKGGKELVGQIVSVKVTVPKGHSLQGELVETQTIQSVTA